GVRLRPHRRDGPAGPRLEAALPARQFLLIWSPAAPRDHFDRHTLEETCYEACSDGVGVARPSRRVGGAGWGAGASVATLAQDRVHQLAADPAADAGVRDRGVDVHQGGPGLPGRGPEAAAATRLGGQGLRPAGDRVVARRQATAAEGPASAAAEVRAALERSPKPRATARAGAATADPGARERRDSGAP